MGLPSCPILCPYHISGTSETGGPGTTFFHPKGANVGELNIDNLGRAPSIPLKDGAYDVVSSGRCICHYDKIVIFLPEDKSSWIVFGEIFLAKGKLGNISRRDAI